MKRLKRILSSLHPEIEIDRETRLIEDGILDSLDIVTLVTDLNDEYKISIGAGDITPQNFCSIDSIESLIRSRGGEVCSL